MVVRQRDNRPNRGHGWYQAARGGIPYPRSHDAPEHADDSERPRGCATRVPHSIVVTRCRVNDAPGYDDVSNAIVSILLGDRSNESIKVWRGSVLSIMCGRTVVFERPRVVSVQLRVVSDE